ncbi:MAG: protein translocase subunit SecF [Myxococcales bacterium]|nr:protein translocase subunit SecF [Myxococcales bacterium]
MSASETPARRTYDFVGRARTFGLLSAILCIACMVLLVVPGPRYGIDFMGGTNVIARFDATADIAAVRESVASLGFEDASVQAFGEGEGLSYLIQTQSVSVLDDARRSELQAAIESAIAATEVEFDETAGDRVYLRVPESAFASVSEGSSAEGSGVANDAVLERAATLATQLTTAIVTAGFEGSVVEPYGASRDRRFVVQLQALQSYFEEHFRSDMGDAFLSIDRVETVGPRVGQQLRDDGIKAVLVSLVLILVYIAIRFDIRYAPGAVLALAHDVLLTLGIFVVLREEVSLTIVAALLTIVGYSLNDTIINFDRIRENLRETGGRESLNSIVNRSINECLSRTFLTAFTTLLAIVVIYFVGGGLIRTFALAMGIGVVVGTYSSIYISNMMMIMTTHFIESRKPVSLE